jgi:cold shock CspA family protein
MRQTSARLAPQRVRTPSIITRNAGFTASVPSPANRAWTYQRPAPPPTPNRAWSHERPAPPHGLPASGSIAVVACGQGHGFIRAEDGRRIYFHRSDSKYGTFNALVVGDPVTFDLHEDPVSGARALNVRRQASG